MSDPQSRVNLRQLRNQAKDLYHSSQTDPAAADTLARIRRHHPKFAQAAPPQVKAEFSLQEAQHVIAREHGHDSWPKLVAAVEDREATDRQPRFTRDELRGLEDLHESLAEGRISPTFFAELLELVAGTRRERDFAPGDHLRFILPLLDHGLEATWLPAMQLGMADIEVEYDPEGPHRRVADPADVVAYVHLVTADDEVALRACYSHKTLVPQLEALAEIGRSSSV